MKRNADPEVITRTQRLWLRRLQADDAALIQPLADNWEVAKQTVNLSFPFNMAEARHFVERAMLAADAGRESVFALVRQEDLALLGLIGLVLDVAPLEAGYWLGQEHWGRGYASEALQATLEYSRQSLNCRRVDAAVFEENTASIRVLTKCGFAYQDCWEEDIPHRGGVRIIRRYQWRTA